jgi:hypothetical protein
LDARIYDFGLTPQEKGRGLKLLDFGLTIWNPLKGMGIKPKIFNPKSKI